MAQTFLRDKLTRFPVEFSFNYYNWFYQNTVLPFNMEAQTKSNWCWAATAKSVSHFYSGLSPWTQCKIASDELSQTCCTTPVPSACNVPWYLNSALDRTHNFVSYQSGTLTYNEIKAQLDLGLVVGVRIGWNGGGGHFMVIYGVSRILFNEYLYIDDPIYGKSVLSYNEFATNYQGSGTWTHSYFTKKYFYFMWLKDLVFNPNLLKVIPEVRPLARFNNPQVKLNEPLPDPEFGTAHHSYVLGLNEINDGMKLPERPVSLRVMEFENAMPFAMYEVGLNEDKPQFMQLNSNQDYFKKFDYALNSLKRHVQDDEQGELRTIRIPALNIEAAWIHFDDESRDKFMPLRLFDENGQEVFAKDDFIAYINRQKARMGKMDELMGA